MVTAPSELPTLDHIAIIVRISINRIYSGDVMGKFLTYQNRRSISLDTFLQDVRQNDASFLRSIRRPLEIVIERFRGCFVDRCGQSDGTEHRGQGCAFDNLGDAFADEEARVRATGMDQLTRPAQRHLTQSPKGSSSVLFQVVIKSPSGL